MIINEVETEAAIFGQKNAPDINFNGQRIDVVQYYKYIGNIIYTMSSAKGHICRETHPHLCNQLKKAMSRMRQNLKNIGKLPSQIFFGGTRRHGNAMIDKVFHCIIQCALVFEATTSNLMLLVESGQMPPTVFCHINIICNRNSLHRLPSRMIVKQIYTSLYRYECGFATLVTKAHEVM